MNIDDIKTLSVLGAGDMGHGIAEVALIAGYKVFLRDIKQEFVDKGAKRIDESLQKLVLKGKVKADHYDRIQKELIHPCVDLQEAVRETDLVIEVAPEILDLKKEIFREVDQLAPSHALLASNTSTMSISEISSATNRPEKVLGLHFFNPVVIMKLVEVIRGSKTTEETMSIGYDFGKNLGKIPVRVEKDVPGFIVNRINAPAHVVRGCILDSGIVGPEEFDALVRKSGAPMGPFELWDYVGIDVGLNVLSYYEKNLHPDYKPYRFLKEMVDQGRFGKKTGKGFYDWSKGRPEIDLEKATDKVDLADITAVQINEATKLIEMGVCAIEDIDVAVVNGSGMKVGPIAMAQDLDPAELTQRLENLSKKYKKEIFLPTNMIRQGDYKLQKGV
ncbi:MAG: 3-hydroxyacyl-CoA dehydrogenase NAD-binding domain-containing protein [Desulfatiglans sp.]|jgi:enoyl-CoA hydratase/3-hydroxyacyl-CoA dehydrogenase|nr:3-hydroxyacyl-CoA dehydrogenase NAD-binding domain-containing protein [Desulfatiglans sp.]